MRPFPTRPDPGAFSGSAPEESGSSLVEVLVAMMVFAILAVGIAFSLLAVLAMTKEGRARQAATNIAAEEIDRVRSAKDLINLGDATRPVTNANGAFVLTRTTQWVSAPGAGTSCGTGSASLQYKRISIAVSWDGMRAGALPVRTDTLLAPRGPINNPVHGTLIVAAQTASGAGTEGVTVSAAPTPGIAGNTAVAVSGPATDAQGCSYLVNVVPGSYDVTIFRTDYITDRQVSPTTKATNIAVTAGTSASVGFVFDRVGLFSINYASNAGPGFRFPSNLDTSFIGTGGVHVSVGTGTASPHRLFPFPAGYAVMAGRYVAPNEGSTAGSPGCISVDPEAWPESATKTAGVRTLSTPTATAGLPMGLLTIAGATGQFITAVSATGDGPDEPGCSVPMTYTFDTMGISGNIALPYGSWILYSGTSKGAQTVQVTAASISSASTGVAAPATVSATTNIVTLDPRMMKTP